MSWKITKKLKETHLSPLGNPFSRSSSTSSTINTSEPEPPKEAPTPPLSTTTTISDPNGIAASEAQASPPPPPLKPGILVLTIHEGKGFSLSEEARKILAGSGGTGASAPKNSYSASARPNSESLGQSYVSGSYGGWGRPKTSGGGINDFPSSHGRYLQKYLPYALVEFEKHEIAVNALSGTPENPFWASNDISYKFDVSRKAEVSFSLFIRNPNAPPSAGRSSDIFIGTCKVLPKFEETHHHVADVIASKSDKDRARAQEKTLGQSGQEWLPIQYGTGSLKIGLEFVENRQRSLHIEDFDLLKVVGKGSFGKVMQVKKKDTERIYALKSIRKAHIISRSEVSHTLAERSVLAQINNSFIVPLKFSFQSPEKLYLVLAFVNGGELFHHLQKEQRFELNRARFYAAELLCALECLHGFNVIYRDLKPENILLDYSGHIALCDFGLCKLDMKDEDTTNTFCGTPEYLAPELLQGGGYTKTVDWWTLGVLLYEMLTGLPPFYDENVNEMYRKILAEPLHFPSDQKIMPPAARDILTKLLDRRPDKRLGVNGAAEIKSHAFFQGIDWRKLLARKYEPAFKPIVMDQRDTTNFDPDFTNEAPADSYVDGPMLSSTAQQQFEGWSYNRPVAGLGDAGGSVKDPSFGSVR